MWKAFPRPRDVDRAKFEHDMQRPVPGKQYVMYFTPRSGSSWLTDIAGKTRRLSIPGEIFNPGFLPEMTRAVNATSMDEYCAVMQRRRNTEDVFGFQITHHQLAAVFRNEADFLARFPGPICFWLIRRDIVLQAISLWKMQQTRIAHAPQSSPDAIAAAEDGLTYDSAGIRRWLLHIHAAETASEAMFARHGLAPLRMSYERNAEMKPNHIVNVMGQHLGIARMQMKPLQSGHSKIATASNDAFAARFRAENRDFIDRIDTARAPMLEQLAYYGPRLRQSPRLRETPPPPE